MNGPFDSQISDLVQRIRSYADPLKEQALRLNEANALVGFDPLDADMWRSTTVADSLVRAYHLIDQNFDPFGTTGVVAVCRYLFEMSIWLKLFDHDHRYGLVYYGELIDTQTRYYKSTLSQMERELRMLSECEERLKSQNGGQSRKAIYAAIAHEAARNFSIYAEQAMMYGYQNQVEMIRNLAIPQAKSRLDELRLEQRTFDIHVLPKIKDIWFDKNNKKRKWNWRDMANRVGIGFEYEYIYSFSSKMLHATPSSISTDQVNLTPEEFIIFMRYIDAKLADLAATSFLYCPAEPDDVQV